MAEAIGRRAEESRKAGRITFLPIYRQGRPFDWPEGGDALAVAVAAYLDHRVGAKPPPSPEQLELLIAYLQYRIRAPRWEHGGAHDLRREARRLSTVSDIARFVRRCLDHGIQAL